METDKSSTHKSKVIIWPDAIFCRQDTRQTWRCIRVFVCTLLLINRRLRSLTSDLTNWNENSSCKVTVFFCFWQVKRTAQERMRKASTLGLFVVAFLFSTLVILRPCQGLSAGGSNWKPRGPGVSQLRTSWIYTGVIKLKSESC